MRILRPVLLMAAAFQVAALFALPESQTLEDALKERELYLQAAANKNREGTAAADFSFTLRSGESKSLYSLEVAGKILLIFYDQDCNSCISILNQLALSEKLAQQINKGEMTVVAIYPGEEKLLWQKHADLLPPNWIVGIDDGLIEEDELYDFPGFPTIYLLNPDRTVAIKELDPSLLIPKLKSS